MGYLIVAALAFGMCYLVDRIFTKTLRGQKQHQTGLSVRYSKRFAVIGLLLAVLGVMAVVNGIGSSAVLLGGGIVVLITGAALIVYYTAFGIFYDADSFILSSFGKGSAVYSFGDIRSQKLYLIQGGSVMIELHLADGRTIGLQSGMDGVYPFLDHAFYAWCRLTGLDPDTCAFHDPSQSKWFPMEEDV